MSGPIHVLLFRTHPDPDEVARAYRQVSAELRGQPGMLADELLRSVSEPDEYLLSSRWESLDALRSWQRGEQHDRVPPSLRVPSDRPLAGGYGLYQPVRAG
ncbi:antibiotic biosynthesis monooxygenase family protein [Actinoalloteichus spitiensis]|uniref:antibiotic biosynthesis monooxygenase family protein n=1 Tax=Actinoalloteichus spitiensis TaxID=252394 RepID=UPI0012F675B5|nr:antibiotic biosynthesis monooxygenase family protein [Actinoalloteichus spitiensis]